MSTDKQTLEARDSTSLRLPASPPTLFVVSPQEAALELFRSGDVSLMRAAEVAGLDSESFRRLLRDRGIAWEIEADTSTEMDQEFAGFLGESV